MENESFNLVIEINILGKFILINCMGMDNFIGLMEMFIRVNSEIIKFKGKVYSLIIMAINILETIFKTKSLEKESLNS